MSAQDEYFEYRVPSKFLGEIQIVLSLIIIVSGLASIASFSAGLSKEGHEKDIAVGYITYTSLAIAVAWMDAIFAIILISGANKISLPRCLLWRGSAITTLALFTLLTLAFIIMIRDPLILLAFMPTLVFKPFALWVVKGFTDELRQIESFPAGFLPCTKLSGLQNPRQLKRRTTIFTVVKGSTRRDSVVVTSKFKPIPEEELSSSIN